MALCGCATFEAGAPGRADIIAHRGASAYAPENTLVAFEKAIEMRADWFELDCTLTKDGEVIVIHDDSLDRTTGVSGNVSETTLAEIRKLEAGAWFDSAFAGEPLPTLGEALDLAKDRIGVYVEIKNADDDGALMAGLLDMAGDADSLVPHHAVDAMAMVEASGTRNLALTRAAIDAIRGRRMTKQVVIQSFSPVVCLIARAEAPEIRTEFLASSNDDRPQWWPEALRWLELTAAQGFNINKKDASAALLADVHRSGRTMAVWTVNDPADMRRFAQMGVDGIITDRPDTCRKALGL